MKKKIIVVVCIIMVALVLLSVLSEFEYVFDKSSNVGVNGSGEPGVSPTISVEDFHWGHRLTITDVNGRQSVDVYDGFDGESYILTWEDKQEITQNIYQSMMDWTLTDFSSEWVSQTLTISDGYLYAGGDPWVIQDENGNSVDSVAPEFPFSLDSLDRSMTYRLVCGVASNETATLLYTNGNTGGGLEARPQTVLEYPDGITCYWEDLSNISDTSFFVVSGVSDRGEGAYLFSYTVPVSLVKSVEQVESYMMLGDEVSIRDEHFAVLGATTLTVTLYVVN